MAHITNYIKRRIAKNKNFIACITGQTGSGKSLSAIRLGMVLDPNFCIKNLCFSPQEFMALVNGKTKKLSKGSCIVYDEIQVSMSHLSYQSIQSKLLNYVLQTFRHKNFILLMTSPHFSYINASLRKLFHCRLETTRINFKEKTCVLKAKMIQVNQKTGTVYEKYLRVSNGNNGVVPVKTLKIVIPPEDMVKSYEDRKDKFTARLNTEIQRELEGIGAKKEKKNPQFNKNRAIELHQQGFSVSVIAERLGVTQAAIYYHLKLKKTQKKFNKTDINQENYADMSVFEHSKPYKAPV